MEDCDSFQNKIEMLKRLGGRRTEMASTTNQKNIPTATACHKVCCCCQQAFDETSAVLTVWGKDDLNQDYGRFKNYGENLLQACVDLRTKREKGYIGHSVLEWKGKIILRECYLRDCKRH